MTSMARALELVREAHDRRLGDARVRHDGGLLLVEGSCEGHLTNN